MRLQPLSLIAFVVLACALGGCGQTAAEYNKDGVFSFQIRDYGMALGAFREAAEKNPINGTYQYNCGAAYQALGQLDQAILRYKAAIALQPGLANAYRNLALCYEATMQPELAKQTYEAGIKSNPLSAAPFYNYGLYFLDKGDTSHAEEFFRKAVVTEPEDSTAHLLLAEFLIREGKRAEGEEHYRLSLQLQPLNPEAVDAMHELVPAETKLPPMKPETAR